MDAVNNNLVVIIGDGMGFTHLSLLMTLKEYSGSLSKFRRSCSVDTRPLGKNVVGESAAGATALSTGVQVSRRRISMNNERKKLTTLLEKAKSKGYVVGCIVSCLLTDATPAAFMSHSFHRKQTATILKGIKNFKPDILVAGVEREDEKSVRESLGNPLLYHFYPGDSPFKKRHVPLETLVHKSLSKLKNEKFVLFIELSHIDRMSHQNNLPGLKKELLSLDRVLQTIFRQVNLNQTTVVLTADHSTGEVLIQNQKKTSFCTTEHTGHLVPLLASGVHAEKLCKLPIVRQYQVGKTLHSIL